MDETLVCDQLHSNESYNEQYFHVVLHITCRWYLWVKPLVLCDHSNESLRAVL